MRDDSFPEDGSFPEQARSDGHAGGWMDARLEAYVDGALPLAERAAFEERLGDAPRWQRAVRRARRLQRDLRALPRPSCPPEVTQAVLDRTVRQKPRRDSPRFDRPAAPRAERPAAWQPALAMALLLAMAAAAALLGRPASAPPREAGGAPYYTHAEVERAEAQAQWTLAFVAQVTHRTGQTIREDVLEDRVVDRVAAPVRAALATPALDDIPPPAARTDADTTRSGR